ncbi:MAG: tetratricopeptide repeat protein [Proteobacteria bacterium]|nr:tetratricopeptide repeat protein [Pseudomonadota bacterium]
MKLALNSQRQESYAGQLARQLVAQQRYAEAADAFRLATSDDPHCPEWWLGLAHCLILQGTHRGAVRALVAATDLDPGNAEAYNELGCLEKHPRLSEEAFRAAIAADPVNALYCANLAVSLFMQWRFDEAEASFRKAMWLDPDNLCYAIDLGHMLMELGRFSVAKSIFRRAARSCRHDAILVGRAWQLYQEQRYDEADETFARRMQTDCDEDIAWAYQGFGLALRKLGENSPAIIAFRAAVSLCPESAVFHRNLADALSAANRKGPATAAYERARQLSSSRGDDPQQGWTIALRGQDHTARHHVRRAAFTRQ